MPFTGARRPLRLMTTQQIHIFLINNPAHVATGSRTALARAGGVAEWNRNGTAC